MMVHSQWVGVLLSCVAGLCNGSFGILSKLPRVRAAEIAPEAHAHWMTQGAALGGLLLLAVPNCRVFSIWGLPSGALLVASVYATFPAINSLGLAAACALWSATATLSSLAWGLLFAGDELARSWLAAIAVVALLAGIAGVSAAQGPWAVPEHDKDRLPLLASVTNNESSPGHALNSNHHQNGAPPLSKPVGVAAAITTGLFGGLVLAPMTVAPEAKRGLAFLPSLGLGALLVGPAIAMVTNRSSEAFVRLQRSAATVPGLLAGLIWAAGNGAAAIAAADPGVGLAVAYPIMQTLGISVAGLWGIVLFGELPGRWRRGLFAASATLVAAGVCLLVMAKSGP